jgi:hypothetical protein
MPTKVLAALFVAALSLPAYSAEPTEEPAVVTSPAAAPQSGSQDKAEEPARDTARGSQPARGANADRLELDTSIVKGNRELPKVLYIVPWKKADLGDLPAQPFNTLLDEVLTPVDRDVFRREVTYYDAVSGGAATSAPSDQTPVDGSEK